MRRKPLVSLLTGSLVFGLIMVGVSLLPEVSGWQQGTLPRKRPAKRQAPESKEKKPTAAAPSAESLPQPPSPVRVSADVQIKKVSTPRSRKTISVFDIVESEPISGKPIGEEKTEPQEATKSKKDPAKTTSAKAAPSPATPEVAPAGKDKKTVRSVVVDSQAKDVTKDAVGTAVRSVDQQPVVRSKNPADEKKTEPRRFGFTIPGADRIERHFKSLIGVTPETSKGDTVPKPEVETSKKEPKKTTTPAEAPAEATSTPRVARKTYLFDLPAITLPRFGAKPVAEDPAQPEEAGSESTPAAKDSAKTVAGALHAPRPLQFRELTPGRSSSAELKEQFGAAQETSQENGVEILMFQVDAFQQVKVAVSDQIVDSIQVFFKKAYTVDEMAKQLDVHAFEPVTVRDSRGSVTGSVYPERGVTLVYEKDSDPVEVKQIKLDSISPVPFMLRARVNQLSHYQDALDDLAEVQRLDPKNDQAYAMQAEILVHMGQFSRALQAVETAMELNPNAHDYQLMRARALFHSGELKDARVALKKIQESDAATTLQKAMATCLQGDLDGRSGSGDYQAAIQQHLAGIKQAKSLITNADHTVSRQAKRLLLEAHLAIASDIAWGDWQNKTSVVPKWLANSQALLKSLLKDPEVDPALMMYTQQQTLLVHMGIASEDSITDLVDDLVASYNELLDTASDALFKQRIRWMAGNGFYYAGRIYQQQGKSQKALQQADNAFHLLTTVGAGRDAVPTQQVLLGDTCFLLGSLHAVYKNDHWEAVSWYKQALDKYQSPEGTKGIWNQGLHGERLVSMGLSFWQSEDHDRGLKLTREGTDMIEVAVEQQNYQAQVLLVPYGNLVAMYRHEEKDKLADQYAERILQLKSTEKEGGSSSKDKEASSQDESAAEEKPTEAKPAEEKPTEAKPAEEKSTEAKPAEEKPTEAKPAEEKPTEAKPAEEKPTEAKPAEEKPTEAKPAEEKPAEAKPVEQKPGQNIPDNPIRKAGKPE